MSERIERYLVIIDDVECGLYDIKDIAESYAKAVNGRVATLVELRGGEDITVNGETDGPPLVSGVDPASGKDGAVVVTMAPWPIVDEARRERDAAIERAEKAEAALRSLEDAYAGLQDLSANLEQQVRNAKLAATVAGFQVDDAAAKFERWAAVRLWAADISHAPGAPMSRAIKSAADLRSHYFPPAKEV